MKRLERRPIEGDRPVVEMHWTFWDINPSTSGHEESRGNLWGPSHKAKYYLTTDSEPVPWGKGEKYSNEESEIVPETVCLQAVGGLCTVYRTAWLRAFCIMSQRVTLRSKVKPEEV